MYLRRSLPAIAAVLVLGLSPLTMSSPAVAATHPAPPDTSFCVPFVNNLEALRSISFMGNVPLAATVANGPRTGAYLTTLLRDINDQVRIFNVEVTSTQSSSREDLLNATIADLRAETTRVQAYRRAVAHLIATKDPAVLTMANADVAVDANRSCLVWAQQLILGFVFAEFAVTNAQVGNLPGDGAHGVATAKGLDQEGRLYRGLVTVKVLKVRSKTGPLRTAKLVITESLYTVGVCLTFSGKSTNYNEAFSARVC